VNTFPVILLALGILVIGYRYYSKFLATTVFKLDDSRVTPAHSQYDGQNYYPMSKWVLFGHHFAGIAGSGPLIGPVLAAQFGFLPGLMWLVFGVVLAGAVQDFVILVASMRSGGKSLAEIARKEINNATGFAAAIAILFVVVIAMAGLGLAVVNALAESPWGTFTIAMTIPLALIMGVWMYKLQPGKGIRAATIFGIIALLAAVIFGKDIASSSLAPFFTFTRTQLDDRTRCVRAGGFGSSGLVVTGSPRLPELLYENWNHRRAHSWSAVGETGFPDARAHEFCSRRRAIVPGPLFPFAFITIACGAISGFHSLISSGTTPKMISKESHARAIGYGAMLVGGMVGIMALVAATSMAPGDYFAINTAPAVYEAKCSRSFPSSIFRSFPRIVGEKIQGRPGGAVSLAVGNGPDFHRHSGYERTDLILVSLRDHVRSALHPYDD
jgi:carbon starvation protein